VIVIRRITVMPRSSPQTASRIETRPLTKVEGPGIIEIQNDRWVRECATGEGETVMSRFTDQVALVAGGTGGLGRAVSLAFLGEGAEVVVTYRKQAELDALRSAAGAASPRLTGHPVDVTDEAAVQLFVDALLARHGRLDVLVNTVGGYAGGAKLWETETRLLDQMLTLNLRSGYVLARAAVPAMLRRGHGAIVNVAATAAFDPPGGLAAYAASKAAAVALLASLAADLNGTGVRVNSILPSLIDTAANRSAMPAADFSKWPKPQDIARVILFLCSDEARVVHGAAIPVDGSG
jgi:NAD(P)-dependent dehydrogenase (short-subunit alcohol dehydrogenase family)